MAFGRDVSPGIYQTRGCGGSGGEGGGIGGVSAKARLRNVSTVWASDGEGALVLCLPHLPCHPSVYLKGVCVGLLEATVLPTAPGEEAI